MATPLIAAGLVCATATAYRQTYSPTVRIDAVYETVQRTKSLHDCTIQEVSKLPDKEQGAFQAIHDQRDALFTWVNVL